jgi:hypothetical protein
LPEIARPVRNSCGLTAFAGVGTMPRAGWQGRFRPADLFLVRTREEKN